MVRGWQWGCHGDARGSIGQGGPTGLAVATKGLLWGGGEGH